MLHLNNYFSIICYFIFFKERVDKRKKMCYNRFMKPLYKCLDSIELCGNNLKCRYDLNNWHVMHTHDFWEIMIVTEGTYKQTFNGQELIMQTMNALLVRPYDVHCVHRGEPNDSHINIVINCDFFRFICNFYEETLYEKLLHSKPQVLQLSSSQFHDIANVVQKLSFYPSDNQPESLKRLLLTSLLNLFQLEFHLEDEAFSDKLMQVFTILSCPENLFMTVQDVVDLTGYSYSHFYKLFKDYTGVSIHKYLTRIKMEYVAYAITKLNTPISKVCELVGYESLGHFSNLFKKYYGMSPLHYKKLMRKSSDSGNKNH